MAVLLSGKLSLKGEGPHNEKKAAPDNPQARPNIAGRSPDFRIIAVGYAFQR